MEKLATCEKIEKREDASFFIEYKTRYARKTMATYPGQDDYEIAKTLSVGDKFIVATRNVELKSTANFQIRDDIYPQDYITRKITR